VVAEWVTCRSQHSVISAAATRCLQLETSM